MACSRLIIIIISGLMIGCSSGIPLSSNAIPESASENVSGSVSKDVPAGANERIEPVTITETPATTSNALSTRIQLRFDAPSRYQDLQLRLLELDDSRCPIGLTCIWAGQILASVELLKDDGQTVKTELRRRASAETEAVILLGYALSLYDLEPHPKKGVTPVREHYVLQVEIGKP